MKAFQCDRCHRFYSETITINVELNDKRFKSVNIFHNENFGYEPFDLCPSCLNSLAEWLQYKKLKEGENDEK